MLGCQVVDSVSEFDTIVNEQKEIEERRRKLEINIIRLVILVSVIGIGSAAINTSVIQSVVSWFSPSGGNNATVLFMFSQNTADPTQVSRYSTPTFNNTFVLVNVSFSDTDLNDWHMMYACNTTGVDYTYNVSASTFNFTCGGHEQLCNSSNRLMTTDNPLYCMISVAGYGKQMQNYTVYVLDSGGKVVYVNSTFYVDRPPTITGFGINKI